MNGSCLLNNSVSQIYTHSTPQLPHAYTHTRTWSDMRTLKINAIHTQILFILTQKHMHKMKIMCTQWDAHSWTHPTHAFTYSHLPSHCDQSVVASVLLSTNYTYDDMYHPHGWGSSGRETSQPLLCHNCVDTRKFEMNGIMYMHKNSHTCAHTHTHTHTHTHMYSHTGCHCCDQFCSSPLSSTNPPPPHWQGSSGEERGKEKQLVANLNSTTAQQSDICPPVGGEEGMRGGRTCWWSYGK